MTLSSISSKRWDTILQKNQCDDPVRIPSRFLRDVVGYNVPYRTGLDFDATVPWGRNGTEVNSAGYPIFYYCCTCHMLNAPTTLASMNVKCLCVAPLTPSSRMLTKKHNWKMVSIFSFRQFADSMIALRRRLSTDQTFCEENQRVIITTVFY